LSFPLWQDDLELRGSQRALVRLPNDHPNGSSRFSPDKLSAADPATEMASIKAPMNISPLIPEKQSQ
jgi:hypothetical protein